MIFCLGLGFFFFFNLLNEMSSYSVSNKTDKRINTLFAAGQEYSAGVAVIGTTFSVYLSIFCKFLYSEHTQHVSLYFPPPACPEFSSEEN